jgi:glycosyltransferase involved in cell wall biosynthesis
MNLAIVTHRFVKGDGQARVNYEIARGALRRGDRLTLLATEVDPALSRSAGVEWVRIPPSSLPTDLCRNLIFARRVASWLRSRRRQFDVLHLNGFITDADAEVNTAHFVHNAWRRRHGRGIPRRPREIYHRSFTALNARWERQAYRRARVVVAVSERVRGELAAIGVPEGRIRVILNGVDIGEFHPGPAERAALTLPEEVPLALFAGEIRTSRKNLDTVLHAMTRVPALHLAVVGETCGSPYPALAVRLGLGDRVRFLGYRRDVARLMRSVDMFVFPSRYEACSLVLLEALASGLPVVTATTTGGAEVVDDDCGILLPDPEDVAGLAAALQELAVDTPGRQRRAHAARARALQHDWRAMTDAYLALYDTVHGEPMSAPHAAGTVPNAH